MVAAPENVAKPTAQELVITRAFEAPRALVWKAWTQREHLLRWSCPKDFIVLFSESDLRAGGGWRVGMRSPEGREYVMFGKYRKIIEPERLVFTHNWEEDEIHDGHETLVTVQLEEKAGRTIMMFTQSNLATASSRDGHAEGWSGAFDLLNNYLHELQNAKG
ncbi:MAG: SRPBCC domain-containing protein [Abitibacteriaceae bacterium]|nr:SRPBCC domain-containing protein [Abditibacteriaceae bacterium]MBV9865291.1 SRPBCC domain-containing protein [Abditibacteriaceae bacterium]